MKENTIPSQKFQDALLTWYAKHKRPLPWRTHKDAYPIWLSEIMLQQTTVATVVPYFHRFLSAFPTVEALAHAKEQDVLHLWQGLGYYSRARNLHKCAKTVVHDHHGTFPETAADLQKLPGIGPYTAAAIAAQAFDQPETVVDGNVERVMSRLYLINTPLPTAKAEIKEKAKALTSHTHPSDYANAIMELGATVCTPKKPLCLTCPVHTFCQAQTPETAQEFPKKAPKKERPTKTGDVWLALDTNNALFLRQRPEKGLLANLWEVPHTGWEDHLPPFPDTSFENIGTIKHVFTHFTLILTVHIAQNLPPHPTQNAFQPNTLPPLPTLMRKVLNKAGL